MSVFGLVSAIAGFVKVRFLEDKEVIDNVVFRLHYRVTSAIMFACCILCTANSLIGNPIDCLAGKAFSGQEKVINTYCWVTSTFTLPSHYNKHVGSQVAAPGVGTGSEEDGKYHAYYQWVPFVLFMQGILFYLPHWIWKSMEEGKVKMISAGLRGATVEGKDKRRAQLSRLVDYLSQSLHYHQIYAFAYFVCEALNFVNVIGNIFFLDKFFGGAFLRYGTRVLEYSSMDQELRVDPMIEIFPRLTKCTFRRFGPSAGIINHDALCVLPLNIINEKIFIFLWFWFILLAVVTGLALCYSVALALLPEARKIILERRFKYKAPASVASIIARTRVGDFLVLHLLGQNMCSLMYHDLLEEFSSKLSNYKAFPTAPLEMKPLYPSKEVYSKEVTD